MHVVYGITSHRILTWHFSTPLSPTPIYKISIWLTHCGPVMPYGDIYILVNIVLSNGLLPEGTKPIPEPMLTNHQQGRQFQTRDGIYRGINRYKPSCHKQVSDTQNVQNCHKQVLNNKTVWNCVSDILQYIMSWLKKKFFFFHFHQVTLLYHHRCMSFWLITYH